MFGRFEEEDNDTSAFSTSGRTEFPPTYEDNKKITEFSTWPTSVLKGRLARYVAFLEDSPMPRAKATSQRIVEHIDFELQWRATNSDWNDGLDYE